MYILKSVGIMSVAKIMGLVYGCMGLIVVPFFLIVGVAGFFAHDDKSAFPFSGLAGLLFAVAFAIFMPLLYGVMGFVFGAIGAAIYNLSAKWLGGLELELALQPSVSFGPGPVLPPATQSN